MQPDKFRYTLITSDESYVLKNAPRGWEETFVNYKRSSDYWGLIRSFTVPLSFTLDGAWLLRREFYTNGLNAKTSLKIEVLNNATWTYNLVYEGEIDFTEFEDENDVATVNVTDTGIAEMVTSSDKAVYEIEMTDEAGAVNVEIPSVSIIDVAQILVDPKDYGSAGLLIMPITVQENQLFNNQVTLQIANEEPNAILSSSVNWFLTANESTQVVLSGRLEGSILFTRFDYNCVIQVRNQDNVIKGTILNAPRVNREVTTDYSLTINMDLGEKLFIVISFNGGNNTVEKFTVDFFSVRITNEVLTDLSISRAFPAWKLFEILLERMNGNGLNSESMLLKSANLFITCGDAIREFENPILKTSFSDFYKSIDAVLGCGFGIEAGVARLESKEFFFREVQTLDMGKVKNFNLRVSDQFLFNSFRIGYKENNYEENQGREEFNQGQVWLTPNNKTDSVLDRVSIYRADQFGIAVLRRLTILDNIQNKDTESDNNVWILQGSGIEIEGVHKLETGADYVFLSGISNRENAININLSPKRCLLRSGSFLSIGLDSYQDDLLRFGSSEKNANVVSEKDGFLVYEDRDIAISVLQKALFLPYLVTVTTDMPKDSFSLIDANLFGFFSFEYNGAIFRGFIEEASNDIGSNTERTISLYLHPDTNLNNFIK